MTYGELMVLNKKRYAWLMDKAETMKGLDKKVATTLTARWIKGRKWEGGLGCGKDVNRMFERLMDEGYTYEQIDEVLQKQMDMVDNYEN